MKWINYFQPLCAEQYYHVYNQGNDGIVIFKDDEDRQRFKDKMEHYLSPFADIIAFALMNNHFHIAIRIKKWTEMTPNISNFRGLQKFIDNINKNNKYIGWDLPSALISEMFRRLTMGYAKYYNRKYKRTGSLFRKGFRRKQIKTEEYLKTVIGYIHCNPDHHQYKTSFKNYKWTSYYNDKSTQSLMRYKLFLSIYETLENYYAFHEKRIIPDDTIENSNI